MQTVHDIGERISGIRPSCLERRKRLGLERSTVALGFPLEAIHYLLGDVSDKEIRHDSIMIARHALPVNGVYFPLAAFPIDSDGVLAGLCALRVMDGHHPAFFPGGYRLSAASCYLAATFFRLSGVGRFGLALTGLTWGVLYLAFSWLFLRTLLGLRVACVAFIFAVVPTAAFVTVTYVPCRR